MGKKFREWNVEQRWLLPASILDFVAEGHLAHFVRDTVRGSLDLSEILGEYEEERGYPPYHPVMMTALLLYESLPVTQADGRAGLWPNQIRPGFPPISAAQPGKGANRVEYALHRSQSLEVGNGKPLRVARGEFRLRHKESEVGALIANNPKTVIRTGS